LQAIANQCSIQPEQHPRSRQQTPLGQYHHVMCVTSLRQHCWWTAAPCPCTQLQTVWPELAEKSAGRWHQPASCASLFCSSRQVAPRCLLLLLHALLTGGQHGNNQAQPELSIYQCTLKCRLRYMNMYIQATRPEDSSGYEAAGSYRKN
jgi:hypothetical protein